VANQKVALLKPLLVFTHDAANVQGSLHKALFARWQRIEDFAELHERRLAAQLVDDVSLGFCDHKRTANRATTLRDDGLEPHRPANVQSDRSFSKGIGAQEQTIFAWLRGPTGHATNHRNFGA